MLFKIQSFTGFDKNEFYGLLFYRTSCILKEGWIKGGGYSDFGCLKI